MAKSKKKAESKNYIYEKIAALIIFISCVIFSFMIPNYQVPDEHTHIIKMGESIGQPNLINEIIPVLGIDPFRIQADSEGIEKVNLEELKNAMNSKTEYDRSLFLPNKINSKVIQRIPAVIGFTIGIVLNLPIFWALQLADIFAAAFYAIICYFALKILPIKKDVMAMFMMLPIILQEAASVSYDSSLTPLIYLFIAYIMYLRYDDDKDEIGILDFVILAINLFLIIFFKIPYALLGFLVFIIPLDKIKIEIGKLKITEKEIRKFRWPVLAALAVIGVIGIYFFRDNIWIQVVYGSIMEWKQTIALFRATYREWGRFLITSSVGDFGWFSAPLPYKFVICVFLAIFAIAFFNRDDEKITSEITAWDRVVVWGTWIVLVLFLTLSMMRHTIMITLFGDENAAGTYNIREAIYQIPYIGGLQGRYFVVISPLVFLPLGQAKEVNTRLMNIIMGAIEGIIFIMSMYVIIKRYWN